MLGETIRATVPRLFGCPLPGRPRSFLAPQAASATLEHQIVDPATGAAVDLSDFVGGGGTVAVRAAEWFAPGKVDNLCAWAFAGDVSDPSAGLVTAELPDALLAQAGVYRLHFGLKTAGDVLRGVSTAYLLVERSLFAADRYAGRGPPALSEVRLELRDVDQRENHTLEDFEFDDTIFVWGLARAVEFWRNDPPPIMPQPSTRTFPFRDQWAHAACGFALEVAAQGYRRDAGLGGGEAGVEVRDRDKEPEYVAEAKRRLETYAQFVRRKKAEIGAAGMFGHHGSIYSRGPRSW